MRGWIAALALVACKESDRDEVREPITPRAARRVVGRSEVHAMFAELHAREAQWMTEQGTYLSTGAAEDDLFPPRPGPVDSAPASWRQLGVRPPAPELHCGYVALAGGRGDPIPEVAASFGMTQPTRSWYVLYGRCDLDGDPAADTEYLSSSEDATLEVRNRGR